MPIRMHDDEVAIDEALVRRLLAHQLPGLAGLPLRIVEPWGTDNGVWRLGRDLVVRLPRIAWAAGQVERDHEWLPRLAPHLSVPVPEPVAVGEPGHGYPFRWAVHRWIEGLPAGPGTIGDDIAFAHGLVEVIRQLRAIPVEGAPAARNRARPLAAYDVATRRAIASSAHLVDAEAATAIWDEALAASPHDGQPVWVHGDLEGNCLVLDGRLSGLVDWGSACAGDPAVDVQVGWSPLCTERSRQVLFDELGVDDATLARSRGAAVNQACAALPYYLGTHPLIVERSWHKLAALGVPRVDGGCCVVPDTAVIPELGEG